MKLLSILTAGLVGAAALAPIAPAAAQHVEHRTVVTKRVVHVAPARAWRTRKVCNTVVRNHHRQRVCRTVRYR